jgi:hypothetical protein
MAGKINLGSRTFPALGKGRLTAPILDSKSGQYTFAADFYGTLLTGLYSTAVLLFDSIMMPNATYLKKIIINGFFIDTVGGKKKADNPTVEFNLFAFGLASNLNTLPTQLIVNSNSIIDQTVYLSGNLNTMPIEFNDSIFIPANTSLVFSGGAYWTTVGTITDQLRINARLVFEY